MKINEKLNLLKQLNLDNGETDKEFKQKILIGKHNEADDESGSNGIWDLSHDILVKAGIDPFNEKIDFDLLQDLIYNLIKY